MRVFLAVVLSLVFATVDGFAATAQTSKQGMPTSHVPYVGAVQLPVSTVGQLPLCDPYNLGITRAVSDASTPTYNGTLTGGGTSKVLAFCNGTNWVGQ